MARARKAPVPGKRLLAKMADEEEDPEWRRWFEEVARRKKQAADPKARPMRFSRFDKDGETGTVRRRQAEPEPVKKFLKKNVQRAGAGLSVDLMLIRSAWGMVVGGDVAGESDVYSFKNGVLTVTVFSSSLLQEIRQFHQDAILRDLRDVWQASQPLVRVGYRLGKR